MEIIYWSDYACPYCYIGEARIKKALSQIPGGENIKLKMKAFQLDPNAPAHVNTNTRERYAAKYGMSLEAAESQIEGISKMGRDMGLDFKYATTLFTNTMDAHRLTKLAQHMCDYETTEKLIDALYYAYFTDNFELADKSVLRKIAVACGLDEKAADDVLNSDKYEDEVRADEYEAAQMGIHGVPFFIIGDAGISGAQSPATFKSYIEAALNEQSANGSADGGAACGPDGCKLEY